MNEHDRQQIEEFYRAIDNKIAGYGDAAFSYLAIKRGDAFELGQAQLTTLSGRDTVGMRRQRA